MDIDACAASGAPAWAERANIVVSSCPGAAPFFDACRASRAGSNVIASKILHFIDSDQVVPRYEIVAASSGRAAADACYEGPLGRARLAFEEALDAGRAVVYATLDLPGAAGDDRYGIFRLVMDPGGDLPPPIVLAHNSGTAYFAKGTLDEAALCADAASWSARAEIATVRRGSAAASVSPREWPALLAAEDPPGPVEADLVEVVLRRGTRPLGEVRVVRISHGRFDDLADGLARTLLASEHPVEDVLALQRLLELDESGALALERVP